MKPCNTVLNLEEKSRNAHGPMFIYKYSSENFGEYKAPKYFPPIGVNHAKVQEVWREEWDIHPAKIIKGLLPDLKLDIYYPGFPHLKYIKHTFEKKEAGVKVFQQDSRGINFILKIEKSEPPNLFDLLKNILGKSVFVNWPHLLEAKVVAISSENDKYYLKESNDPTPIHEQFDMKQVKLWHSTVEDLKSKTLKRWGIDIGETDYVIHAKLMTGRNYVAYHDGKVILEKKWAEVEQPFPHQSIVKNITIYDKEYKEYTIHEYFKPGTKVIGFTKKSMDNSKQWLYSEQCPNPLQGSSPPDPNVTYQLFDR
ncbi:5'-3' exoribonuclease 1, partial [Armadillidium nasatum]